jgi:hypothetical protein
LTIADTAAVWSAVAAIFSAIAASISFYVAMQARRIQGNAADFSNCLEAVRNLAEAQRRVIEAQDCEDRLKFEFRELLNLLEALALLVNDGRIAPSTHKFMMKLAQLYIPVDEGICE